MAVVRVMRAEGGEREIEAYAGRSLLAALHDAGVPAVCGGQGSCGKCRVRVHDGFLPVSFSDKEFFSQEQLEAGYRLACAAFPDGDIGIEIFETGEDRFSIVNDFRQDEEEAAGVWEDFFILKRTGGLLPAGWLLTGCSLTPSCGNPQSWWTRRPPCCRANSGNSAFTGSGAGYSV